MGTGRQGRGNAFDAFPLERLLGVKLFLRWELKVYETVSLGRMIDLWGETEMSAFYSE